MTSEAPPLLAICFDFDGVLVDSEPLHLEAERRALASRGIDFTLAEKARFVGGTVRGTAERICANYEISDVDSYFQERQGHFEELVDSDLRPMPGALGALERLGTHGVRMALVSSGEGDYVRSALSALGLGGVFGVMVTQRDVSRHKPDPEPYLTAAKLMRVPPGRCMAVEDSPTGLASAADAGMVCLAVPGPATAGTDLSRAYAVVDSLDWMSTENISRLFGDPSG